MKFYNLNPYRGSNSMVRIIGHRGARGLYPENSLLGFMNVLKSGIEIIELDIVFSKDGIPIITHDQDISPFFCRDSKGEFIKDKIKISALNAEELYTYDIGRFNPETEYGKYFPEQIQLDGIFLSSLQELLNLVQLPEYQHANLLIEIKSDPDILDKDRKKIISVLAKQIKDANLINRVIFHSFDWALLSQCKHHAPGILTSYLTKTIHDDDIDIQVSNWNSSIEEVQNPSVIPEKIYEAGGSIWCPHFKEITKDSLLAAEKYNLLVFAWTVNEPADIDIMIDLGVDAIVTDYPPRVKKCLASKGMNWNTALSG